MKRMHVEIPQEELARFCRKWRVASLSLFGSVLRDGFGPGSDVDVLVDFVEDAGWSLFDLMDMRQELALLVGRPVDLVDTAAIRNPFRRDGILATKTPVYTAS